MLEIYPIPSMTDDAAAAWVGMGISKDAQIERLRDWANMLERRLAMIDKDYRSYQYGRATDRVIQRRNHDS